eukprot:TRINITY_DN23137_c0_g1_i1.p1 TRINITY_DN23137_c0_g1~~TRINITY_DN23137_c0_g1_i1.p1  ORF type:complete len:452 (-),score=123.91 TRINITY_DN23137_c0_g1_i1:327-1682(-)
MLRNFRTSVLMLVLATAGTVLFYFGSSFQNDNTLIYRPESLPASTSSPPVSMTQPLAGATSSESQPASVFGIGDFAITALPLPFKPFYSYVEYMKDNETSRLFDELERRQNPDDCRQARLVVRNRTFDWGLGGEVHMWAQFMFMAWDTDRAFVNLPQRWRYSPQPDCPTHASDCFMRPLGRCTVDALRPDEASELPPGGRAVMKSSAQRVVRIEGDYRDYYLGQYGGPDRRSGLKSTSPDAYYHQLSVSKLERLGTPRWFWTRLVAFICRPQRNVLEAIERHKEATRYGTDQFTVGLQVRRGNIVKHGVAYFNVSSYVDHIQEYLLRQPSYEPQRSTVGVYLMSSDPGIIAETKLFPQFRWMIREHIDSISERPEVPIGYDVTLNLLVDIHLVAASEFMVGSKHSNLGHLLMELALAWHPLEAVGDIGCLFGGWEVDGVYREECSAIIDDD